MPTLNLPKAVKNNPIYARSTKPRWDQRFYQVARELGFVNQTPSAQAFAEAVFRWQKSQSGLDADGMLGPKSWAKLEPRTRYSLDLNQPPPPWITEVPPGTPIDRPLDPMGPAGPEGPPKPNGVTDVLEEQVNADPSLQNTLVNTGVTVASVGLGYLPTRGLTNYGMLGNFVQPLVWAYQGNTGDWADKVLYGLGCFPPLTLAAGLVSIWKGWMDDMAADVLRKTNEVIADEPPHLAKAIFPTATYKWPSHPDINAQHIAKAGGTAWQHPNGLWVYLKLEKNGKPVMTCDYKPRRAVKVLGPQLPLTWSGGWWGWGAGFIYRSHKGGY